MDANDYFKHGKEYFEKENYSQAIADFWKGIEMTHEPGYVEFMRANTKDFDSDILAVCLLENLHQALKERERKEREREEREQKERERIERERKEREERERKERKEREERERKKREATSHVNRAMEFYEKKDFENAIAELIDAVRIDKTLLPQLIALYFERGANCLNEKDFENAIASFTEAIKLDQKYAQAYFGRAQAYFGKGDYGPSISDYTAAIQHDLGNDTARAYKLRGAAYIGQGNYDAALGDFEKAAEIEPTKYSEDLEKLRNDPDAVPAFYKRGVAYNEKGDYSAALENLERALKLDPANNDYREAIEKAKAGQERIAKEEKKNKRNKGICLLLQLVLMAAYLIFLWGTDIIRNLWIADGWFLQLLPLAGYALVNSIIITIFRESSDFFVGFLIFCAMAMAITQTITVCVWKGNVGILLIYFLGRLVLNVLSVLPGSIWVALVARDADEKKKNP
jgi:tetratricopeptide (TPR) repeat protein